MSYCAEKLQPACPNLGFLENYDEFKGQFELGKDIFPGNTLENVFLVWSDQFQQLLLLKI